MGLATYTAALMMLSAIFMRRTAFHISKQVRPVFRSILVPSFLAVRSTVSDRPIAPPVSNSSPPSVPKVNQYKRTTLLGDLKDWRKRTADELQRPIYKIMSNQMMEDVVRLRPRKSEELVELDGVGPFKLKQYGKMIIDIVNKHVGSGDDTTDNGVDTTTFWDRIKEYKDSKPKPPSKTKVSKKAPIATDSNFHLIASSKQAVEPTKKAKAAPKKRKSAIPIMSAADLDRLDVEVIALSSLNQEQQAAAQHILGGHNVFITGSAGTGKSYLLRYVIQEMLKAFGEETVAVTAPTGIAAINIGGQTVHSFAGIGLGRGERPAIVKKVMKNKSAVDRWKQTKVLIIDEISMLDRNLFELLDEISRKVRGNDLPFGGIQVVVVGDFMQLPPVQNTGFAFESDVWIAAGFEVRKGTIYLQQVVRQSDADFIHYLNEVRLGIYSREFHMRLQECLVTNKPKPTNGIIPTKLYAVNKQVDEENTMRLAELQGEELVVKAKDMWKVLPSKKILEEFLIEGVEQMIPKEIRLKVGAQVMLLRNRSRMTFGGAIQATGPSLVNGSRGKIVAFSESVLHPGMMLPTVMFDNGMTVTIGPVEYEYKGPQGDGKIIRQQVPLKLAWAATVHKSQGCTLTCAELMLDRAFDFGQTYVALSRVKNLDGLWLSTALKSSAVKAHPLVLNFYGYVMN